MNIEALPLWLIGGLFSLFAGLATGIGALPIFFTKNISLRTQDIFMGFGAGVMLAATSFSLIIPGLDVAGRDFFGANIMVIGILLGGICLWLGDRFIPHEHFYKGVEGQSAINIKRVWLFVYAITLHNLPEGLAVGVSFGTGDLASGMTLALGIGLQNIPEGLVVALALVTIGYSKMRAFLVALLTGLIEPIGGLLGASIVTLFHPLLPWGLAFAAGAMLYVISDEIIPESHRKGHARQATFGLMVGFVAMLFLDVVFS